MKVYKDIFVLESIHNSDVPYNSKYADISLFAIDAISDYVKGEKVIEYIENEIIFKLLGNLSEVQKVKLCKAQIKEYFYIEGNKFPG